MLREFVAKRLIGLKKAGIKTPIIDQTARPAKVVHMSVFSGLDLQDMLRDWISRITRKPAPTPPVPVPVPTIVKGLVTAPDIGWFRVNFPRTVKNAVVTASSNARITDFISRAIERTIRPDFNSADYCDAVASGARDRAHELDLGFLLNPVKAIIADTLVYWTFYAGWFAMGWILNVLWDLSVQPQIDRVTEALNDRFFDILQMWGLPWATDGAHTAPTFPMLRNVSDSGFEFLSLGNMDVWFTAVGDPD